ncbi:Hypothetical_protein [Hexamita inflata]|uniref:Hypothetical_protein n=1 Tax=Hexamita inflata TaxID=28002 RepID=A0AA86QU85_9EUKA|nr:Hypothetical protein HINF_LOCUS53794 [Hexamita inflata]
MTQSDTISEKKLRLDIMHENIYQSFKSMFSQSIYDNVKINTQNKLKVNVHGWSTVSKVTFDNYLSILFTLFITETNNIKQCWKEHDSLMTVLESKDHMDYEYWMLIHSNICYGFVQENIIKKETNNNYQIDEAELRIASFQGMLQQQLGTVMDNTDCEGKIQKNSMQSYDQAVQNLYDEQSNLYQSVQFPPLKSQNKSSQMFVFFIRNVLINSFRLFKMQTQNYNFCIQIFIKKLIHQIQSYKNEYQKKSTPSRIEQVSRGPHKKPVHEYLTKDHKRIQNECLRSCVSCKQCNTRKGCSCKLKYLCEECFICHIQDIKTNLCYKVHKRSKKQMEQ